MCFVVKVVKLVVRTGIVFVAVGNPNTLSEVKRAPGAVSIVGQVECDSGAEGPPLVQIHRVSDVPTDRRAKLLPLKDLTSLIDAAVLTDQVAEYLDRALAVDKRDLAPKLEEHKRATGRQGPRSAAD